MKPSEFPPNSRSKTARLPHWAAPIILAQAFLLVHILAPWGISLLSTRFGWVDGRPGPWNLLAMVLVAAGIAGTIGMIILHYQASPGTFVEFKPSQKLIKPGLYSFSRNPMYLLELLFWFGWMLFYGSIPVLIGFLIFLVILHFWIVPFEERDLEKRFGESYRQYKQRVPRWLV